MDVIVKEEELISIQLKIQNLMSSQRKDWNSEILSLPRFMYSKSANCSDNIAWKKSFLVRFLSAENSFAKVFSLWGLPPSPTPAPRPRKP